jgi:hypothetical protein
MKPLSEFYDLKSKLLENEEKIINNIQGNSIEEKASNTINWFIHNEVKDKPKSNHSSTSKRKRGKMISTGNQKQFLSSQRKKTKVPYLV